MAKPPAPTFRSQGNALFRTDQQVVNYRRGQEVPYDINGAPVGGGGGGITDGNKGDITVSGGGLTWTVNPDVITYDKMQNVSAASRVLGRGSAGGAGNVEELTLGAGLVMTGTVLSSTVTGGAADGLGPDGDKGDVTVGGGGTTLTIDAKAVTLAKMADVASATVFYRKTAASGSPEVQTLATLKTDLGLSGTNTGDQTTITGNAGTATKLATPRNISITGDLGWTVSFDGSTDVSAVGTIPANAVTYAKMQDISAASRLIGRGSAGGAGDPEEIALGTNLGMSGTTLGLVSLSGLTDGAKVRKAATLTGQNLTAGAAIAWDTEDWDTGGYHSTVSNTDRLTVTNPGYYEVKGVARIDNVTVNVQINFELFRYNSAGVLQETISRSNFSSAGGFPSGSISGTAFFNAGDYVTTFLLVATDTSVDIHTASHLEIRRVVFGGANPNRGCLVRKAVTQVGGNYSASVPITWDFNVWDTDGIHSTTVNTSRLVVPAGVTKARVTSNVQVNNLTANVTLVLEIIINGGGAATGYAQTRVGLGVTQSAIQAQSAIMEVVPGDYFEARLTCSDTNIDVTAGSWAQLEIIETAPGAAMPYLPLAGGTLTGKVTTMASIAGGAGMTLPHGVVPTTPANGDVWTTTAGMYVRINGATVGPLGAGGGGADGLGPDGDKGDITVGGTGTTLTIDAGAVTLAKMANVNSGTVFYRKTAAAGVPEVQTLATLKTDLGLTGSNSGDQTITLTGDVTGSGTGSFAATIANNAVTLAKMADIASARFIGRVTASAGDPEELSGTQATALLDVVTSALKGLAPASGGGTANFLRADGTWQPPPAAGAPAWGSITGTLSAQTDLQTALDGKVNDTGDTMTGALTINTLTNPALIVNAASGAPIIAIQRAGVTAAMLQAGTDGATYLYNSAGNGIIFGIVATEKFRIADTSILAAVPITAPTLNATTLNVSGTATLGDADADITNVLGNLKIKHAANNVTGSMISGAAGEFWITTVNTAEAAFTKLALRASQIDLRPNGTTVASATAAGLAVTGNLSVNGDVLDTAWTAYTPVATAASGAITTYTATGAYKRIGKTVHMRIKFDLTNIGTASGNIRITAPFNAVGGASDFQALNGFEANLDNFSIRPALQGGSTTIYLAKTDGTFVGASGRIYYITGTYECA